MPVKTTKEQRDALDAEVYSYIKAYGPKRLSNICDELASVVVATMPSGSSVKRCITASLQRLRGSKLTASYSVFWRAI